MSGISASRTGRARVLVVDDEHALTEALSVAVAEAGRRPCPAADGRGAPRIVRACAPHAVVLDGTLPGLHSSSCPGAERREPSARVACPSARYTLGPTENGR
ncbi:hypothetical protein ACIBW9_31840 [Streptomyces sp. NPDC049541]|uniref:hypothetical protein n=1 Tax=Streptomyces sp. NPDC049541 TaxID=3365594 RepID=UPI0037BE18B2